MAYDGTLKFDTSLNADGFKKGANKLGEILGGLGIGAMLEKMVQMVSDSVDRAMGRLDTMAQFSRVMVTMTGSVDQTNAALQKTNEIVDGTAYGLDVGAKAVQNFVAKGLSISTATSSLENWGNAVAFYGDGTNASLSSVTDALGKMQTKGNVTMEHLEMLFTAGIPAIEIYADAMGVSTEEVTASMKKGELNTSDFIKVMNNAFEEGTTKFPSIANAAKEAGNSWAGSTDNMKAAVTRGMSAIIEQFDKMFNVKKGMVDFGKGIEAIMKGIADNMTFVIPTVIALTGALIALKVVNTLKPAFGAFKGALEASKIVITELTASVKNNEGAIKNKEAATLAATASEKGLTVVMAVGNVIKAAGAAIMNVFTGATVAGAAATGGLAVAVKALGVAIHSALGVFGWILLVIVAATAAVSGIINAVRSACKEYYAEIDAIGELKKAHEEYENQLTADKQAYTDGRNEKMAEVEANRTLIGSLNELMGANDAAGTKNTEIAQTVKMLNSQIEGLGLAYDGTTQQLNMTNDELIAYTNALEATTDYETKQSEYNRLLGEQTQLQQKINAQKEKEKQYEQMMKDGTITWYNRNQLMYESGKLLKEYEDAYSDLSTEVKVAYGMMNEAHNEEAELLIKETEIRNNQMKSVKQYSKEFGMSSEEIIAAAKKMEGGLEQWYNEQSAKFTKSGMDVGMLAEKWGMAVEQIDAYCNQWSMNYEEFNEEMKATHTDAGLSVEQLAAKWGVSAYEIEKWIAMNESDTQGWSDMVEGEFAAQKEVYDGYFNAVTDGFTRMEQGSAISLKKFMENMQFNQEATANWGSNMTALMAAGVDSGVIAKLKSMGPEGAATAQLWVGELTKLNDGTDISLGTLNDTAQAKLDELSGVMSTGATTAAEAAKTDAIIENYISTGGEYSTAISEGYVLNDKLNETATESGTKGMEGLGTAINASTAPIDATNQQVEQISAALANGDYTGLTAGMAKAINTGAGAVTFAVSSVSEKVQRNMMDMSTKSLQIVNTMMNNITTKISTSQAAITTATTIIVNAVKTTLDTLHAKTQESIRKTVEIIQTELGKKDNVIASAQNVVDGIISKFDGLTGQAKAVISDMFAGMSFAMDSLAPSLYNKAQTIAREIIRILKTAFNIHSPSRVTYDIFKDVMQGAINAMDNGSDKLLDLTKTSNYKLLSQFEMIPDEIKFDWGQKMKNAIAGTHKSIADGMSIFVGLKDSNANSVANTTGNNDKMVTLLAEQNKLLSALLNKDEDVYLGTTKVGSKLKQWDKDRGIQISKGAFNDVY